MKKEEFLKGLAKRRDEVEKDKPFLAVNGREVGTDVLLFTHLSFTGNYLNLNHKVRAKKVYDLGLVKFHLLFDPKSDDMLLVQENRDSIKGVDISDAPQGVIDQINLKGFLSWSNNK